ncbi:MAG: MFS transporter [Candidatus Thermoplasmatota archaeon]|nr:MFS transporter [Candidatus Thermoplasmatota archaeon]
MPKSSSTLTGSVLLIAFSAFFADLGYQAVIVGLPLFLVVALGAPVYIYGLAEALNYGVGSLFSFFGGRLSARFGSRRIAILGNSLIPILSLTGFATTVPEAIGAFAGGWWARNFRSPARRTMMSESVSRENRSRAYGLLHGLDVGGGLIATVVFIAMISLGYQFRIIFLITAAPLIISTLLIAAVKMKPAEAAGQETGAVTNDRAFRGVIFASALFGFSYYSMGFPILTVATATGSFALGAFTYTVFLAVSAATGFVMSRFRFRLEILPLGLLGYILAGIGALLFAITILDHMQTVVYYAAVMIIGIGSGFTEIFEPTIISKVSHSVGKGMGWLSASRSAGLFMANLVMGALYFISPAYAYIYAFAVAVTAGIIVIVSGAGYDRSLRSSSLP